MRFTAVTALLLAVALVVLICACTAPTPRSTQNNTTVAATQEANATPISARILPVGNHFGTAGGVESKIDAEHAEHSELRLKFTVSSTISCG